MGNFSLLLGERGYFILKEMIDTERHAIGGAQKNWLFFHRKKMGYSQRYIATLLGYNSSARVSDYERGRRLPSLGTALKLQVILCAPVDALYKDLYQEVKQEVIEARNHLQPDGV